MRSWCARAAASVLLTALSSGSGGCAWATMAATGAATWEPKDEYHTWKDTMDWMGTPKPGEGPNILGGILFTLYAVPWFILETEAFLITLIADAVCRLADSGHDMHLTKRWCCWWAVLFGSRRYNLDSWGRPLRGAEAVE